MISTRWLPLLALILAAGCTSQEAARQIDTEIQSVKSRISEAQEERKSYGEGSVVHDLATLRIAIHEQTLAMLEQRRVADKAKITLSYTVEGKPYFAPADLAAGTEALEKRLKDAHAGRESDLQLMKEAGEAVKSLYVMSAGTKSILIAQLEYQLAGHRNGFPPYYVPFSPPKSGTTPPQIIEVPAGKSAIVH